MRQLNAFLRESKLIPDYVVYQFGKVGSKSIISGLDNALNVHNLVYGSSPCPPNFAANTTKLQRRLFLRGLFAARRISIRTRKPKLIVGVRDPVQRNVSMYFHHLHAFMFSYTTGFPYGYKNANRIQAETSDNFLMDVFLNNFDHNYPIEWFDKEFKPVTGIDIYAQKLNLEQGWSVFSVNGFDVFMYKYEALSSLSQPLSDFCESSVIIGKKNRSQDKWYSDIYRGFQSQPLPDEFLSKMYNSKFCQFFGYSA